MPKFSDWRSAAANILNSFTPQVGDMQDASRRIVDQLGQWFGHLVRNAAIHWSPSIIRRQECEFCDEDALLSCIACGASCCVAHAHVSFRAEGICDECVEGVVATKKSSGERGKRKARQSPRDRYETPPAQPQAQQKNQHQMAAEALKVLGLKPGATWEEVSAAYKARARANHPDRFSDDFDKKQADDRLKTINAAFNFLKTVYPRAA